MSKHDKPQFDARDVSMVLPRKAPPYLDKEGNIIESDPLQKSWKEIGEVFARLHGQRIVEVMRAVLGQMPAKESIELLWDHDESVIFYMEFSNGWRLSSWMEPGDQDSTYGTDGHIKKVSAPDWFPKDQVGFDQWKQWHSVVGDGYVIAPEVDSLVNRRLTEAQVEAGGAFGKKDIDLIERSLVGAEWMAAMEFVSLDDQLPKATGKPRAARM